ncbi:MAG: hypothetical protein LLF78_06470 [Synergistaceae bacterium]|nr:hypothetical protein [Synergistaceae bacterium]
MADIDKFWRDAPSNYPVCASTKVTKNMVLNAIVAGARDLDTLKKIVPLCPDNECSKHNPLGHGCKENAETLLAIYVPIYDLMMEGGGCKHGNRINAATPSPSDRKNSDGCGRLCDDEK